MTSVERLWLSAELVKHATAGIPKPGGPIASTMMRGVKQYGKRGLRGQNPNQPIGPAAIGASKVAPGGLTDKARPGLIV